MVSFDEKNRFASARDFMVQHHLAGRDITDRAVLEAMANIPREEFLPPGYRDQAYDDRPVPIGMGQTISQPYIVALMTQCLALTGSEEVLEIGTGSGYQTALLAALCKKVYTIERHNQLCESAQAALARLNVHNVEFYIGDGSAGWYEKKLFDRIIVTAALPKIPQPLIEQLTVGGIIAAPVGGELSQDLIVCEKTKTELTEKTICGCRFVKLIGKYGFTEDR